MNSWEGGSVLAGIAVDGERGLGNPNMTPESVA